MNYYLIGNILLIVVVLFLFMSNSNKKKEMDNLKNAKKEEIKVIFKDEWNAEEKTYKQKRADQETTLRILDEKIKDLELINKIYREKSTGNKHSNIVYKYEENYC